MNAQTPRHTAEKTTWQLQNTRKSWLCPEDAHIAGSKDLLEQSVEVLLLRAQVAFVLRLQTELPVFHPTLAENVTLITHYRLLCSLTPEEFLGDVQRISKTEVFTTE